MCSSKKLLVNSEFIIYKALRWLFKNDLKCFNKNRLCKQLIRLQFRFVQVVRKHLESFLVLNWGLSMTYFLLLLFISGNAAMVPDAVPVFKSWYA